MAKQLKVTVKGGSLRVTFNDPVARYLISGRRSGPMMWLRKARRPVPIETPTGVIFRWPSAKSFTGRGWRHPGRQPSDLMERIKDRVAPVVGDELRRSIADQIRKALKK